jgi:hypothetical protein
LFFPAFGYLHDGMTSLTDERVDVPERRDLAEQRLVCGRERLYSSACRLKACTAGGSGRTALKFRPTYSWNMSAVWLRLLSSPAILDQRDREPRFAGLEDHKSLISSLGGLEESLFGTGTDGSTGSSSRIVSQDASCSIGRDISSFSNLGDSSNDFLRRFFFLYMQIKTKTASATTIGITIAAGSHLLLRLDATTEAGGEVSLLLIELGLASALVLVLESSDSRLSPPSFLPMAIWTIWDSLWDSKVAVIFTKTVLV